MNDSNIGLADLPSEILYIILKKLNNMDVLYSLINVNNQRLDIIIKEKIFTETLNFVLITKTNDVLPIDDSMLDRFCVSILAKIDYNIISLILESESMERILFAAHYPNLTKLKLRNVNDRIVSRYFIVKSPFRHIFQKQIKDLTLVYDNDTKILLKRQYPNGVHDHILQFFENLIDLSITGSCTFLFLSHLPLTTCSSSTLSKLCVRVNRFEDCLALLDGRLKQLTTMIISIDSRNYRIRRNFNKNRLSNLKCFSLQCSCENKDYDTRIVPLLRRMSNLEELTLNCGINDRTDFIDGTQINENVLVHLPRLHKFMFHIRTYVTDQNLVHHLSEDDIRRTFTNIGYEQVGCILTYHSFTATCNIFSLPFMFDQFGLIGHTFPSGTFTHVTHLTVNDKIPFEHEYFLRIAHCFPSLKTLYVMNRESQSNILINSNYSIVEYPSLISLDLRFSHINYVEQFLNDTKTHLPHLTELKVDYNQLKTVTENFTRNATRLNCMKIKRLNIENPIVHSKDFYDYFPILCLF